jgi:molecular chaperone DnaJ
MAPTTTAQRDYYEVLGLSKTAKLDAIKDAFRKLAMKYHPDRNKEPGAEERFKEIAEAYAVLSDPQKRADYDARGFAAVGNSSGEDMFSNINFDDLFGGLNLDFGGGRFGNFFGQKHSRPKQGGNIEVNLQVSLERVANGGSETIKISHPTICSACHGAGVKGGAAPRKCETCGGSGRVSTSKRQDQEHVIIQQISTCPVCKGHGQIIEHPCPECHGSGQSSKQEKLSVKIPRGIEEGMALRIPGKGMPAPDIKGKPGDLLVIVSTQHDPRFERTGKNLLHRRSIPLTDAVLGSKLNVQTLNGAASVTIPPGTQPESILRLKGKGLPEFGSDRYGDLYLQLSVQIPTTLSSEEHKLYERLRVLVKDRRN